ncbi:MAG TPA: response regulator transcription factor [Gemmatimonadales bacterium]|jgi:DNA-binding response OmpR family regulator|nr:response regulator transcription factor [Gemmatimonadales bacterium]
MARILIIEDNRNLAHGLVTNLRFEGHEAEVAEDGGTGLSRALARAHQLILLDLMLPEADGFHVLERLRADGVDTPVLVLTARGDEVDKVRGLRSGADDYVTKPFGLRELLARIEALLRRGRPVATALAFGAVKVDPATHEVTRAGRPVSLRPKEYELLRALLRRQGRVATRGELLREVWGYRDCVVSRTLDTHVGELRRKLEPDPARPRHILTVRKAGYRLIPES